MNDQLKPRPASDGDVLAAIDLGSNSFHMLIGRVDNGAIVILERLKEMVQLGAGLDEERLLSDAAQERGLACLQRFGPHVRTLPEQKVRVVGTNTLRVARNTERFLERAQQALGHGVEVISGIEEARLIYAGVVRDLAPSEERRLVVDIGGGSTELVIGQGTTPLDLESVYLGSVAMMKRHFADGKINARRFLRAELSALQELERVQGRFRRLGWSSAVGASGTIRAVARVVHENALGASGLTREAVRRVRDAVIEAGSVERLGFNGLSRSRATVLPGGLAVLSAVFESLGLASMDVSSSALREGLLNDLMGRSSPRDVRSATVDALMDRYHVDKEQARRVEQTLIGLLPCVRQSWDLPEARARELCSWAARLHEIGLDIAHSHYHKHGAYVLEHADMPGFSRQEQHQLSALVRAHRRKFPSGVWKGNAATAHLLEHLAVLLRLAVLLNRSRTNVGDAPELHLAGTRRCLELRFAPGWLEAHPLTLADLLEEAELLQAGGFELKIGGAARELKSSAPPHAGPGPRGA
jgi:exopolyphosphatase / guanosine-5'-triphosphate,3'-diphosphate pyrophosphatase